MRYEMDPIYIQTSMKSGGSLALALEEKKT